MLNCKQRYDEIRCEVVETSSRLNRKCRAIGCNIEIVEGGYLYDRTNVFLTKGNALYPNYHQDHSKFLIPASEASSLEAFIESDIQVCASKSTKTKE